MFATLFGLGCKHHSIISNQNYIDLKNVMVRWSDDFVAYWSIDFFISPEVLCCTINACNAFYYRIRALLILFLNLRKTKMMWIGVISNRFSFFFTSSRRDYASNKFFDIFLFFKWSVTAFRQFKNFIRSEFSLAMLSFWLKNWIAPSCYVVRVRSFWLSSLLQYL